MVENALSDGIMIIAVWSGLLLAAFLLLNALFPCPYGHWRIGSSCRTFGFALRSKLDSALVFVWNRLFCRR